MQPACDTVIKRALVFVRLQGGRTWLNSVASSIFALDKRYNARQSKYPYLKHSPFVYSRKGCKAVTTEFRAEMRTTMEHKFRNGKGLYLAASWRQWTFGHCVKALCKGTVQRNCAKKLCIGTSPLIPPRATVHRRRRRDHAADPPRLHAG